MRLGIFVLVGTLAALLGSPTARAERSEIAWMFEQFEPSSKATVKGKHATRSERRQTRLRVASLESSSDALEDAQPQRRRSARAEVRQRVRVASLEREVSVADVGARYSGVGPRPRKWCGWWMRTQRGGGPEFNVAWNWRNYGSPIPGPQIGAVVVWRHHVGEIVGQTADGRWIVRSGNDGGRVRERVRSVAGAIFRI